jgi:predicted Zn-ribbon and HTH transcriptional regulator
MEECKHCGHTWDKLKSENCPECKMYPGENPEDYSKYISTKQEDEDLLEEF